ncbi:repressor of the inhibitor of the protein kinase [Chionoecetes opilio]|uniref:Repressor of the inhibitor of the protein kinase n=1 Tax=Chionoecetes opilio TaxID=41210 RepID=A0A8J4XPQ3_CHIOP|nr:repressor of the inhibitor of the protein kinase [Chionoecetes opilio]
MKSRFSQDKRAHYELCALIPEVIVKQSTAEVKELGQCLLVKWNHVMPLPSAFQSELQRWMNYWKRQLPISASSVTNLLTFHADATFFPNLRELLKILAVLPVGSVEAQRSFSCLRRIHNWLRNTMATEKLSDLAVIAMHGHEVPISRADICKRYMDLHPRRMMASSLFDGRDGD